MTRTTTTPPALAPRGSDQRFRNRIYDDLRHDPYQAKGKYKEPAVCGDCGAVFHDGRWAWATAPEGVAKAECPACHRIRDKQPAGYIKLTGVLAESDREVLVRIARNVEKRENTEHPLNRIMGIEMDGGNVLITTTDVHLAQRIGEGIVHAQKGKLKIFYGHDEYVAHAYWHK
jgi:hypothetical protein